MKLLLCTAFCFLRAALAMQFIQNSEQSFGPCYPASCPGELKEMINVFENSVNVLSMTRGNGQKFTINDHGSAVQGVKVINKMSINGAGQSAALLDVTLKLIVTFPWSIEDASISTTDNDAAWAVRNHISGLHVLQPRDYFRVKRNNVDNDINNDKIYNVLFLFLEVRWCDNEDICDEHDEDRMARQIARELPLHLAQHINTVEKQMDRVEEHVDKAEEAAKSLWSRMFGRRRAVVKTSGQGKIMAFNGICLDSTQRSMNGGKVYMSECNSDNKNQWYYDRTTGQIKATCGTCLEAIGGKVHMWGCDTSKQDQQWSYDVTTGQIANSHGICLHASEPGKVGGLVHMSSCDSTSTNQRWSLI